MERFYEWMQCIHVTHIAYYLNVSPHEPEVQECADVFNSTVPSNKAYNKIKNAIEFECVITYE